MVVLFDHFWGQLHWETDSNCSFSTGFNASLILHGVQDGSRRGIREVPLSSYLLKIFRSFWTQNNHTFISFFFLFYSLSSTIQNFLLLLSVWGEVWTWCHELGKCEILKKGTFVSCKNIKKMVCWEFNCFSYSCKSLIIFLLLCSCFTAFTWPSYPRESITCDIMKQFESVAKWSPKKKAEVAICLWSLQPLGLPCHYTHYSCHCTSHQYSRVHRGR